MNRAYGDRTYANQVQMFLAITADVKQEYMGIRQLSGRREDDQPPLPFLAMANDGIRSFMVTPLYHMLTQNSLTVKFFT